MKLSVLRRFVVPIAIAWALAGCRESVADGKPAAPGAVQAPASSSRLEPKPAVLRVASSHDAGRVIAGPLPLLKRTKKLVRTAKVAHPSGMVDGCTDDVAYPEIEGALEAGPRAKLNRKLWPIAFPIEPVCDTPYEFELSYEVRLNAHGLLSVVYDTASCCGAHPSFGKKFVNLTIPKGDELTLERLLEPSAGSRLREFLKPLVDKRFKQGDFGPEIDEILDQLTREPADFSISPEGLELSAFNSQPHVVQSLYTEPFVVPFAKLSTLLRTPSPLEPLTPRP